MQILLLLQESIIDLKSRSMRDNLVFSGIHEERGENTEEILQEFIKRKFRIDYDVSFERVHRMGRWSEHNLYPRNIVAKFTYFKERELIRTRAPQKLKGSNVWVNEQFPPEIEERRKKLYPIMRLAKRDGKHVRLTKDLLYINGQLYDPDKDVSTQPERLPYSRVVNSGSRQPQKRPRHGSTPDRVDRDAWKFRQQRHLVFYPLMSADSGKNYSILILLHLFVNTMFYA